MDETKSKGIYQKFRKDGTSYVVVLIGDFPINKFDEWIKDCKENFSDCRWAKAWNDHTKAKMFDLMVQGKFDIMQPKKEAPKQEFCIGGEEIR